jgi:transposase InsO family protein
MDHYAKAYPIFSRIKGIEEVKEMLSSLKRFSKDEVAQERLRIIEFYDEYGECATKKAFRVGRNTLWVWKQRLKNNRNKISSLIPDSTTPKSRRQMQTSPKVLAHIRYLREKHTRLGKEKIKPLLDQYCKKEKIVTISESTIGKVIKRNNFYFQKSGKLYHNPNSAWAKRRVNKKKRNRVKKPPRPESFGYIEMDTVIKFVDAVKVYFLTAIDVKLKFAFSLPYGKLNSRNTVDFFKKLRTVYPITIITVQTDNGLEFLGEFEEYLEKQNIPHVFIYPRCCKINGTIERFNRTIQEDFIDENLHIVADQKLFSSKLIEYLIFYNTERPHKSLGLQSPLGYLQKQCGMSNNSVTYTLI